MANTTNHDYHHGPPKRQSDCHPDRRHFGNGLCASCYHRNRRYGLSPDEVRDMFEAQNGRCLLCDAVMLEPHVDHDHEHGFVRGLLCERCNLRLGWVESVGLNAIAGYLSVPAALR